MAEEVVKIKKEANEWVRLRRKQREERKCTGGEVSLKRRTPLHFLKQEGK